MQKYQRRLSAFSLIEVSISLLVLGIISAVSMSQLKVVHKLYSNQKTQQNIEFVVKSIAAYYIATEGKLPYPSSKEINIGVQNESLKNSFGIVPFKSLGINESLAKNSKGKWLLYRMNPSFGLIAASEQQKSMGIKGFFPSIANDKVAIIIKSEGENSNDEHIVWYSERNFISIFANNKVTPMSHNAAVNVGDAI